MHKTTIIIAGLMMVNMATSALANAAGDHQDGAHMQNMEGMGHDHQKMDNMEGMNHGMQGNMEKNKMFMEKKDIDGYQVSFHVMPAKADMQHGGSHNVMIKVEKDGVALNDVVINSKVFLPNKSTDSKMLMKMGDWYMAGYDLDATGKNGIMILFKTADGQKHKGSVYYPEAK